MSSTGDALGGRLPLAHRSTMSEPQLQLYDHMTKSVVPWSEHAGFASQSSNGQFIGPFNPALHSPIICGSFLDFQATPRVRQVVILTLRAVWQSAYECPDPPVAAFLLISPTHQAQRKDHGHTRFRRWCRWSRHGVEPR
jgi:hypothetical protein